MKKEFESSYEKIIERANKNPNCKVLNKNEYAFINCNNKAYFIERRGDKGVGFLLENEKEKELIKRTYRLFKPVKMEIKF